MMTCPLLYPFDAGQTQTNPVTSVSAFANATKQVLQVHASVTGILAEVAYCLITVRQASSQL